jgi:hypothetical protein
MGIIWILYGYVWMGMDMYGCGKNKRPGRGSDWVGTDERQHSSVESERKIRDGKTKRCPMSNPNKV